MTANDVALEAELAALAADWRATRVRWSSRSAKITEHPSYWRIIGKGSDAVPFILRELPREPDHCPVPPLDRGDIDAMARAWITWGRERGLLDGEPGLDAPAEIVR